MSENPVTRQRQDAGPAAAGAGTWQPDPAELEEVVRQLEAIYRPSASVGEREAAEWIAWRLRETGCAVRVEEEVAHGTYWWPVGLMCMAGVVAGMLALRGRRLIGALIGALAAAGIADDIDSGPQVFRHRFLPYHPTWNVVAEAGDTNAADTIVVVAHHDAAHGGLVFHPGPQRALARRFPDFIERQSTGTPFWFPVIGGPVLVAVGSLLGSKAMVRLGVFLGLGSSAAMVDIGRRPAVPGANDNLSAVAVLVAIARSLHERPISGLRVLLVSAGSEESLQEGILAFARRHFQELLPERTRFVMLDTVGSPRLVMVAAEGTLKMRHYDRELGDLIAASAAEVGVDLVRGLRARASTDAVVPNKAGYRTALLVSFDQYKQLSNYHQPTDVADNLDFGTVAGCARVMDAVVRKLAG
jgi:Zn-dependent M28 family amino/carboxypeptidase